MNVRGSREPSLDRLRPAFSKGLNDVGPDGQVASQPLALQDRSRRPEATCCCEGTVCGLAAKGALVLVRQSTKRVKVRRPRRQTDGRKV